VTLTYFDNMPRQQLNARRSADVTKGEQKTYFKNCHCKIWLGVSVRAEKSGQNRVVDRTDTFLVPAWVLEGLRQQSVSRNGFLEDEVRLNGVFSVRASVLKTQWQPNSWISVTPNIEVNCRVGNL
jgi:hypothetical protein